MAAAALLVAAAGCSPEPPLLGSGPALPAIRLLSLPASVTQPDTPLASGGRKSLGPVAHWRGAALRSWIRVGPPDVVRMRSTALPSETPPAGRIRVALRPGGATSIVLVPHAHGSQPEREHRALRAITLSLERDAAGDQAVIVEADLHEALHGNFGDAGRGGRLAYVEIELPGADPARAMLLEVTIERRDPLPSSDPAGAAVVEHGGVLRPAFFAQAGATVAVEVDVPEREAFLAWHDAALPQTGARVVEIVSDGKAVALERSAPAIAALAAPWSLRRASLARWGGRRVEVRMRVEDEGVGFFANPRLESDDASADRPLDVLVYLIDTLRNDHLGAGGSEVADVSPTIDRLAEEGVHFRFAQSHSPWTKPAIATLMSGLLPTTHGVGASSYMDQMPATVDLVQERFQAAGWRTGSFSASPLGSTLSALERGFDAAWPPRFWRGRAQLDMNPSATQLQRALLEWIDEEPGAPFFAYVHTLEVHEWKLPRYQRGQQDGPQRGPSPYDAAIADADGQLGDLLAGLELRGRTSDLLVVVSSDHGESWGDHGMPSHGFGLYQSQIHVPLVFWAPGRLAPHAVEAPVGLADLAPTLVDLFGLPPLPESEGASLAPLLAGGDAPPPRTLPAALLRFVWAPDAPQQHSLTTSDRRKVVHSATGARATFDLVIDPGETRPSREAPPALAQELSDWLVEQKSRARAFRERHGELSAGAITQDDVERLRALGYLE